MPIPINQFRVFDLMFIRIENPRSHSQVEGKISSCGRVCEASIGYEEAMLSQPFIAEHS